MTTFNNFDQKLSKGIGVNLTQVFTLSQVDINKFKTQGRNWKINGVNYALLNSEQGCNADIISALKNSEIACWLTFEKNPSPAELRLAKQLGIEAVIIPATELNELKNVSSRVARAGLYSIISQGTVGREYQYSVSSIHTLKDSGIDGIIDYSKEVNLGKSAIHSGLEVFAGNLINARELINSGGAGIVHYMSGLNPKLVLDCYNGDLAAYGELLLRLNASEKSYKKDFANLIAKIF